MNKEHKRINTDDTSLEAEQGGAGDGKQRVGGV